MRCAAEAAVAAAAIVLAASCGRQPPAAAPPSIVLLTIDTLRADYLGSYGHTQARTPALDALARRGVRFEAATTPFPRTTPALASMMTGLLPWRHGSREVGQPMIATLATVPSILARRGYRTLGVCVNGAAGKAQHLDVGFERFLDYQSFTDHTAAGVTDATLALLDEVFGASGASAGTVVPVRGADAASGRTAQGRVAANDRATTTAPPFLLWVHYIDPHFPYAPPESWRDQPAAPRCRQMTARSASDLVATAHVRIDLGGEASAALADCESLYDAEIAFTDHHLGRLLDGLASRGLLASSVVVFTSDHGENLGEDGLYYEHGPSVSDASLRVPLLIAGPGIEPRVDRAMARLEDLAPTLLALARVPATEWPAFDGVDLSARLLGGASAKRSAGRAQGGDGVNGAGGSAGEPTTALAESGGALLPETFLYLASGHPGDRQCVNGARYSLCDDTDGAQHLYDHVADPFLKRDVSARHADVVAALLAVKRRWPPGQARERTVRTARFKLVERPRPEGGWSASLYDLENDPGETRDLAATQPATVERMRRELDAAFARVSPAPPPELDPAELAALRALGYVR